VRSASRFVKALLLSDVPPESMVGAEVEGTKLLISNLGGEIHAVSGVCTHEDFDLGEGIVIEEAIVCPQHLSQFDLRTGRVYNPPATIPLKVFNVKIDGDAILVEV